MMLLYLCVVRVLCSLLPFDRSGYVAFRHVDFWSLDVDCDGAHLPEPMLLIDSFCLKVVGKVQKRQ
jgi:hypothetical protein